LLTSQEVSCTCEISGAIFPHHSSPALRATVRPVDVCAAPPRLQEQPCASLRVAGGSAAAKGSSESAINTLLAGLAAAKRAVAAGRWSPSMWPSLTRSPRKKAVVHWQRRHRTAPAPQNSGKARTVCRTGAKPGRGPRSGARDPFGRPGGSLSSRSSITCCSRRELGAGAPTG
jgi:hypothetical protein